MNKTEHSGLSKDSGLSYNPSSRVIRVFEATDRLGNLSAAAAERDISPSVVSHQLRVLETFLHQPLTRRQGRRLILSSAGRESGSGH